jgi:phosphate transport system substrate-binding protein
MSKKILICLIVAVFITLPQVALAGISYSGSSTIGTGVLEAGAMKAFEEKTGIKFISFEQPGSGKGIQALIDGKVSLAGASRPLKAKEKKQKLMGHIIGYDAIAVFVHKSNPVKNLSKKQLKGIFTGKIKNWKEVGGKDAPITPNTQILSEKRATLEMFKKLAMDGAPYGKGFKEIDLPTDQLVELSKDENGIATVSIGLKGSVDSSVSSKIKSVSVNRVEPTEKNVSTGAYLISRPLLFVTKGLPKGDLKKFIKFIFSKKGQDIVHKNFVCAKGDSHEKRQEHAGHSH